MSSWPAFPDPPKSVQLIVQPDVQIAEHALAEVQLSGEVCTLSDFRASVAARIERARATGQPTIITQHGRASAVLLGAEAFKSLLREVELLREVRAGEDEIDAGHAKEHERVEARLRGLLGR
jgi:prevent-host-death family protein